MFHLAKGLYDSWNKKQRKYIYNYNINYMIIL